MCLERFCLNPSHCLSPPHTRWRRNALPLHKCSVLPQGVGHYLGDKSPDMSPREVLDWVNWGRKTRPKCGWYHRGGWGLWVNKSLLITYIDFSQLPSGAYNAPIPSHCAVLTTIGEPLNCDPSKPFLKLYYLVILLQQRASECSEIASAWHQIRAFDKGSGHVWAPVLMLPRCALCELSYFPSQPCATNFSDT